METKEYIHTMLNQLKNEKSRFIDDMKRTSSLLRHRTKEPHSNIPERPIYNSLPLDAIKTCVHGVAGYLLSPSIRWFKFITYGENHEDSDTLYGANDWLEQTTTLMYSMFSNSRFYATSLEALEDSIITGTSYEMITDTKDGVVFDTYNPYECYIAENDKGDVDTFFREYSMTALQAYKRFGDKLPNDVKRLIDEKNYSVECKFVHAIFPREDYKYGIVSAKSKRFASIHYSQIGDEIFYESGYDEFPLAVHRWEKVSGSAYGNGLAMQYLPEIIRLNDLTQQYSIAVQFQASPILQAPEQFKNKFIYRAGAVNYTPPNAGKIEVVNNQLNIQYLGNQIAELETKLNRLLYADLFNVLMRQERQRTAYEVQELKGEGLILLSAIIGNMQIEKLNPLVLRTFRILLKNGAVEMPPESLVKASKSGKVEVELDGPLAQTMKAYHQATGLEQGLAVIGNVIQVFPDSLSNFDGDEIARQYATSKGLPQSCIREISDVKKIKEAQAKAQEEAQNQQQALQQSQIMKNLGYDVGQVAGMNQEAMNGTNRSQTL